MPNSKIPANLKKIDKSLRDLVVKFELLSNVNPINITSEKKKFFKNRFTQNPNFQYKDLNIQLFEFKRNLASIPAETIENQDIRVLYEDTIESFIEKIDMLAHLGEQKFLYSSLKYFGQPNERDIKQAQFLLMCPDFIEEDDALIYSAEEAAQQFTEAQTQMGFSYKVNLKKNMVARAMASGAKKSVSINSNVRFSKRDIEGLLQHEVGIHLGTSLNAKTQTLRIFSIGFPNNTKTQEGMAVATEYFTDNINLARLRELALRVIAVNSMVKGDDFKSTFMQLVDQYGYDEDRAFRLATRVFRGGGFTKDYLYLRGLRIIINALEIGTDISPLLCGKTSIDYLSTIEKMIELGYVQPPEYIPPFFKDKSLMDTHPILRYILEGVA